MISKSTSQAVAELARASSPYFAEIERALAGWQSRGGAKEALLAARKNMRSIRGAARIIGLDHFAETVSELEQALREAAESGHPMEPGASRLIRCVAILKSYLAGDRGSDCTLNSARVHLRVWRAKQPRTQMAAPTSMRVMEAYVASGIYAIPASAVVRVLRLAQGKLEWSGGQRTFRVSGAHWGTLPALDLDDALGWETARDEPDPQCPVLIVESQGLRAAWIVDRLGGMPEVEVAPSPDLLGTVHGVAGTVLHADGVMLVIEVASLLQQIRPRSHHNSNVIYLASRAS